MRGHRLTGLIAALVLLTSPALAQSNSLATGGDGRLADFSPRPLAEAVAGFGFATTINMQTGQAVVITGMPDGRSVLLIPSYCEGGRCRGLKLVAPLPDNKGLDAVNRFNLSNNVVRAVRGPNGIYLDNYLVGDDGYSLVNLETSIRILWESINHWWQLTGDPRNTVEVSFSPLLPVAPPTGDPPHLAREPRPLPMVADANGPR